MSSSFLICIDTADGVRNTAVAAVVKLPVSAIATKVRKHVEVEQRQWVIERGVHGVRSFK